MKPVHLCKLQLDVEYFDAMSDEQLTCFVCGGPQPEGEIHFAGNGSRYVKGIHDVCRMRTAQLQDRRASHREANEAEE